MQRQRALSTNSGDLKETKDGLYAESSVEVEDYTSINNGTISKNLNQNINVRIDEQVDMEYTSSPVSVGKKACESPS